MNRHEDDRGAVDPGMRDAERSIDAVGEGAYDPDATSGTAARMGGRAGHSTTTDHDAIRQWADDRHATPATVAGTEHDGAVGELRLDFDFGQDLEDLRSVGWDEWLRAFDERGLEFVFADQPRADGSVSNDFYLEPRRTAV